MFIYIMIFQILNIVFLNIQDVRIFLHKYIWGIFLTGHTLVVSSRSNACR